MDWFTALAKAAGPVAQTMGSKGWPVSFGGPDLRTGTPKVPQPARSEFLQNRALGDWAEQLLASAIADIGLGVSHYGASDDIDSADPDFAAFFIDQILQVRHGGKRPDLLVAHTPDGLPLTIGSLPATERDQCLKNAFASIEVRSSKYKALKYMRVKAERKVARAKSVGRLEPNFTVKVEDLQILYRWVEQHRMPQAYVQVFLDSAFAINVLTIFQLIGTWARGLTLEKPVRSQDKPTIFIPISYGTKIGDLVQAPHFEARTRESPLGKVDAYVVPQGGKLILNRDAMLAVLIHQRVGQ